MAVVRTPHVVVVGAGVGGLAAAAVLAHHGLRVTVLERAATVGGKLRCLDAGGEPVDAGPTVFTLRPLFEALFAALGETLAARLPLAPLHTLARHAWADGARLDLLADHAATCDEIGRFAGAAEARRYAHFCARSQRIFDALDSTFMRAPRPNPVSLLWRAGWRGLPAMLGISPFATLWGELCREFQHPRLRQLFGRYATYCGSSPWQAPATLMLVAHAERCGVWAVQGGMHRVATTLAQLARERGASVRCHAPVARLLLQQGRAAGVVLADGEAMAADAVVFNGDAQALAQGLLGEAARVAVAPRPAATRSLSALTWTGLAQCSGWPLARHTVLFSDDYAAEFNDLQHARRLPNAPTVYLCAQDRADAAPAPAGAERLLCLVNAPATGDAGAASAEEIAACEHATFTHLQRCGLQLSWLPGTVQRTTPRQFHRLFPGTGGALYGQATQGWAASFQRPGSLSRVPGLYLAGGSVHPGPGVPMAATSGLLAAQAVLAQRGFQISTSRWRPEVMPGGTSTR